MKRKIFAVVFAAAMTWAGICRASDPFDFLSLDAGARAVGMGGAYTALATDADALLYNPAGLARVERHEATFMHNQFVAGISQEYLAYATPYGWGANLNYFDFGEVRRRTISNPGGSGLAAAGLTGLALGLGYGRAYDKHLAFGAAVKFVRESIAGFSANGFGLDLGILYAVPMVRNLALGAAVQNIGPSVRFQSEKEQLPLNLRWGGAYSLTVKGQEVTAALDIVKARSEAAVVGMGVEVVVAKTAAVRLGYNGRNEAGPGIVAGVGWIYRNLSLDYAFTPYGGLGDSHRISATMRFGAAPQAAKAESRPRPAAAPPTPEERFAKAEEFIDAGKYKNAKEELKAAYAMLAKKDNRRVRYFERMGMISYLEGDIAAAKGRFTEALRTAIALGIESAHAADSYLGIGLCLAKESDLSAAERYFLKALEAGPSPETRERVEKALESIKKAPSEDQKEQ